MGTHRLWLRSLVPLVLAMTTGCSLRMLAVRQLGNALAAQGTTFASDDDPELVGDALPFALKLMESVLAECPDHRPLLIAAARGFTQYAYGWVSPAEDDEARRARTRRLALRGRDYALRALRLSPDRLEADPRGALAAMTRNDVPALYWTAAAWGLAISEGKDDLELLADLPTVEALITRAAELDPEYDHGAIDTFLIAFEASRMAVSKDAAARSRAHFDRAVLLTHGQVATPFVTAAESLAVPNQDAEEFDALLTRALNIDVDARPELRLQNILAQRRAAWLREHRSDLFLEPSGGDR